MQIDNLLTKMGYSTHGSIINFSFVLSLIFLDFAVACNILKRVFVQNSFGLAGQMKES